LGIPGGIHMESTWNLSFHMESTWNSHGNRMEFMWNIPYGFLVEIPCGMGRFHVE